MLENGASLDCSWGSWDSPMSNALAGDNEEIVEMIRSHTNATDDQIDAARATAKTKTKVTFTENLNESNLDRLETQLGVKLPPVYRSFLESFPDDLVTNDDQGVFHSTELILRSVFLFCLLVLSLRTGSVSCFARSRFRSLARDWRPKERRRCDSNVALIGES
jgi:hypothetical protein